MLLAGVIGFGLTLLLLNQNAETVVVVVAGTDLPSGTELEPGTYEEVEIPADANFNGRFASESRLTEEPLRLAHAVEAGAPIPLSALVASSDVGVRSEFSVPVSTDKLPGGRLAIGDRVHVLAVIAQGSTTYSTFVATNVEVVGVPGSGAETAGFPSGTGGAFVTVALTNDQLLTVTAAQGLGALELARTNAAAPPVDVSQSGVGTGGGVIVVPRDALVSAQEAEAQPSSSSTTAPVTTEPEAPALNADDDPEGDPEGGDDQ